MIVEINSLNKIENATLKKFSDIKYAYDRIIQFNSNVEKDPRCCITYSGLNEYKEYDSNSLSFIHELSLKEAVETYLNPKRRTKRTLSTIILTTISGNLGELSFALDYSMEYKEFEKQMLEKSALNKATAYDLFHLGKKVEIKTAHYKFLYDSYDNCVPIDTSNTTYIHPKWWRKEYGGFDFMSIFYVWEGRFRPLGELIWNKYFMKSFFYGSGAGEQGNYYADKILKDPSLGKKIMIPFADLDPVGTYLTLPKA